MRLLPIICSVAILMVVSLASYAPERSPVERKQKSVFPFRVDQPDTVFTLPKILSEISGLATLEDGHVAAVQDEIGTIFLIDPHSGDVVRSVRFSGRGDYEGIERAGGFLYVLESNGDLFQVNADYTEWSDRTESRRIRTRLSSRCDAEGLGIDASQGDLMIACKEYPGKGLGRRRSIYRFDLITETIDPRPDMVLSPDDVADALGEEKLSYGRFKPSAVAFHAASEHFFLISSRNRFIVELDRSGHVLSGAKLELDRLRQPEGITFLPDGRMMIASEAKGETASLMTFSPTPDSF